MPVRPSLQVDQLDQAGHLRRKRRGLLLQLLLIAAWALACLSFGYDFKSKVDADVVSKLAEFVIFVTGMGMAQLSSLTQHARRPLVLGFFFISVSSVSDWIDEFVSYTEQVDVVIETVEAMFAFGLIFAGIGFYRWLQWQEQILAQQAERTQHFRLLSELDGLTDVYNRAVLDRELPQQLQLAQHARGDLALLLIDLDHFKRINDQYGHSVGDQVLRGFAHMLKSVFNNHKLIFRYGGEEFALLLPAMSASDATQVAERLRQETQSMTVDNQDGHTVTVTTSVGVALAKPGDTAMSLLQRADEALYQAKQSGRNRVCLADVG